MKEVVSNQSALDRTGREMVWDRSVSGDLGKVLLIYPNTGMDVFGINVGLPLSCLYLGTVLENAGYRVEIIDERVTSSFESDVAQKIKYAVCGHTHYRKWFVDNNVEWYINPRGYITRGEGTSWSMVQIDTDQ